MISGNSQIIVFGDIHGKCDSLLRTLLRLKNEIGFLNDNFKIANENDYMLFLGDYSGRGEFSVDVWYTLIRLKLANPDRVMLLRGNHETVNQAVHDGFEYEIRAKYLKIRPYHIYYIN